jgi:branched-chain amino acid aminotransferase
MPYFFDNEFCKQLKIDVDDLGLLRGYCAFEYLRTYNKVPFCLKAHLLRFFHSMKTLGIISKYSLEEMEQITLKLIEQHGGDCGVKWYATGGSSADGLHFNDSPKFFAFTIPIKDTPMHLYEEGIITETLKEKRPLASSKTTAYLAPSVKLSLKPHLGEVIYIDHENKLLEAATSNLFFVKENKLFTANEDILFGITREVVLELAKSLNIEVVFEKVSIQDLSMYDEAFVTATNKQIMPIKQIDSNFFKVGPTTKTLIKKFEEFKLNTPLLECIPLLYQDSLMQTVDAL